MFLVGIVFINFMLPIHAKIKKVIRVGYPLQNGITMKDGNGQYYGYDYDYLMQISQYTGWTYEFVEVEGTLNERLMKMLEMLKNGEIDLLGSLVYSDKLAEDYDYASEPYGNSYNVLAVPNDSELVDLNSLINKKGLILAANSSSNSKFEKMSQYCEMNGIKFGTAIGAEKELVELIGDKQADALLTTDLSIPEGYHAVTRFSPTPFYFASTKGNSEIINELNVALTRIGELNPTFMSASYNRYFSGDISSFALSKTEKEFIERKQTFKALVFDGNAPIEYVSENNIKGIGKDILDSVVKKTGIHIEYVFASSYEDYLDKIANEDIDLLLSVPYDVSIAENFNINLTSPYLTSNLLLVTHDSVDPTSLDICCQAYLKGNAPINMRQSTEKTYDNAGQILVAIDKNEAGYAYLNNYLSTYYINRYNLTNISTFETPDYMRSQYSFGVSVKHDFTMVSILNKAIRSLTDEAMNDYIYQNAYTEKGFSLFAYLQQHFMSVILIILVLISIGLYFVRAYYKNQLQMKNAIEMEYKRFLMLSEITGEITFSYDYEKDALKINQYGIGKLSTVGVIQPFSKALDEEVSRQGINHLLWQYLENKVDVNDEVQVCLLDEVLKWYTITIKIVKDNTGDQAIYAIGKVLDIQEDKKERELLIERSLTDSLTGILNRAGIEEVLSERLVRSDENGIFIMLDLDNFKEVNDRLGHVVGDVVLKETGELLSDIYKEGYIARLGGDEFVVYLENANSKESEALYQETLYKIKQLNCLKDSDLLLTVSMGVINTTSKDTFVQLIKRADIGLYKVKQTGRNNYCLIDENE